MEIGSVLEVDNLDNYRYCDLNKNIIFPFMMENDRNYRTFFYQNARNALQSLAEYLMSDNSNIQFLIPDFICDTVKESFLRVGANIKLYRVDKRLNINYEYIDCRINENSCVLIPHYFGKKVSDGLKSAIVKWKEKGITIIEDITMSMLSKDKDYVGFGDYVVGSIRKWLPIPDGGFCCVAEGKDFESNCIESCGDYVYLYTIVQMLKREYINGRETDKKKKEIYLSYYRDAVSVLFSDYTIRKMSRFAYNYIGNCDFESIAKQRNRNYDFLCKELMSCSGLSILVQREYGYTPFMFTFLVNARDELLQYLILHDVYCNIHWNVTNPVYEDTRFLSTHIMSIPCDQRYNENHMKKIVELVRKFMEK